MGSLIVLIIVGVMLYFAIKEIIRSKNGCAYCKHSDGCPFNRK